MNRLKSEVIALIADGIRALVYASLGFTRATHETRIGPIAL